MLQSTSKTDKCSEPEIKHYANANYISSNMILKETLFHSLQKKIWLTGENDHAQ